MTIAFGTIGTSDVLIPLAVPYPASIAAGDLLILHIVTKYPPNNPTTPAGWTVMGVTTGGAGAAGADSGDVTLAVYYKVAVGDETGSLSVTTTGANTGIGRMGRYTRSAGTGWTIDVLTGSDNTAGTAYNAAFTGNLDLHKGDGVLVIAGVNVEVVGGLASTSLSPTGTARIAFTNRSIGGTSDGDNVGILWYDALNVLGGVTPPGTLTFNGTFTTITPAGPALLIRLRETGGVNAYATVAKSQSPISSLVTNSPRNSMIQHMIGSSP